MSNDFSKRLFSIYEFYLIAILGPQGIIGFVSLKIFFKVSEYC
jgi:hypothetical protein